MGLLTVGGYTKKKNLLIVLIILAIISIYLVSGIFLKFSRGVHYANIGTKYKDASTYMGLAWVINNDIIYRNRVFGVNNIINKPFYALRDILFNIGYSKYPKGEGEKEFWWYKIKFEDYENTLLECRISKNLSKTYNNFMKIDDDLYNHIDIFADAKITSKTNREFVIQKLVYFVNLARTYSDSNDIIKSNLERDNQAKLGLPKTITYLSEDDMKKYEHVYNTYINLLNYSKVHEKESYKNYYSAPIYWQNGDEFIFHLVSNILESKLYNNKLNYNDKYVKIFADEHRKIRNSCFPSGYYKKINKSLTPYASSIPLNVNPIIAYKCQNSPYMKDYIKYCFILRSRDRKMFKITQPDNVKTIDDIKNEIINGYKRDKEYGKLEQLKSIGIR